MPGRSGRAARPARSARSGRTRLPAASGRGTDGGKLWGLHRLDSRWAVRLVAAAQVQPGDLVLDVGAGAGALTSALLDAGARVIAVELHPARAAALRQGFKHQPVRVVQADASDLRMPRRPFKVVANPPFAITTAVLRRLTSSQSRLECAVLVLPTWAVTRWASGRGTARGHTTFAFSAGPRVPPRAFSPPPPSPARVLEIHRRSARFRPTR